MAVVERRAFVRDERRSGGRGLGGEGETETRPRGAMVGRERNDQKRRGLVRFRWNSRSNHGC